jgi:hypothetical protein
MVVLDPPYWYVPATLVMIDEQKQLQLLIVSIILLFEFEHADMAS